MAQAMVNFRMDEELKKNMEETCKDLGLSMTTAFTIFAKKMTTIAIPSTNNTEKIILRLFFIIHVFLFQAKTYHTHSPPACQGSSDRSLLIFFQDYLSIDVSGGLKFLTITMLLSVFPFMPVNICLIF